jgi:hypothetical protein
MSIIQEALKKAERQIKDTKQIPAADGASRVKTPDTSGPVESRKPPVTGHDPRAVAILLVILIVTAVVAASQLFPKKNIPAKSSVPGEAVSKPAVVTSKNEELPILPSVIFQQPHDAVQSDEKKPTTPEFVLNGIMYLEGSPRAIINDSMVEVGDAVNGATVVKIDKKNVLLEYNGAEISLDLKR